MSLSILRILNMDISDRINDRLKTLGLKGVDITKAVGISSGGVSQWRNGATTPASEKIFPLSRLLQCDPEWLVTGKVATIKNINIYDPQEEAEGLTLDSSALGAPSISSGYMNVPVYDVELAAGYTGFYDHDHESETMSVSMDCLEKNNVPSDSASIVTVRGSSMESTLCDGDTVLIDLSTTRPISGKVFAFNFDGDLRVKRFVLQLDRMWRIVSDNEDKELYPDEIVPANSLSHLSIVGRVAAILERSM